MGGREKVGRGPVRRGLRRRGSMLGIEEPPAEGAEGGVALSYFSSVLPVPSEFEPIRGPSPEAAEAAVGPPAQKGGPVAFVV